MVQNAISYAASGIQPAIIGLAIDDSRAFRTVMANALARLGYQPIGASDGYEGWKLATSVSPHIILTDLDMPNWNGCQLIKAVRSSKLAEIRNTPIIVCSTTTDFRAIEKAINAGATAFIPKPIRIPILLDCIRAATMKHPFGEVPFG